jgi:hypothetical protein
LIRYNLHAASNDGNVFNTFFTFSTRLPLLDIYEEGGAQQYVAVFIFDPDGSLIVNSDRDGALTTSLKATVSLVRNLPGTLGPYINVIE